MNQAGELKKILLVLCILMSVLIPSVFAGDLQNPVDNTAQIPILNETKTTTTAPGSQNLPIHSTPPNMAPVNPAYLRYLQQQQAAKLSSTNSMTNDPVKPVSSHPTGAIPLYEDMSYLKGTFVVDDSGISSTPGTNQHAAFPAYYDLRASGRVSPVKNQGVGQVCWAFATVASLESTLLPGEVWDFSENNMKNLLSDLYPEGFDRNFSTGGATHKESTAYLVRWTGPINQSDDPYNAMSPYSPTNKTVQKHLQRVDFIPDRLSSTDNDNIKTAIQNFGAVYTTYNMSELIPAYWNETTKSYYYFGDAELNHAVAIVGWDDRWSRNNFTTTPPGDGAFIIRNSWGSTWGDSGYFYCSYYDKLIGKDNALFTSAPPTNYDHIYQYDPLGWVTSSYTAGEKVGWAANVFNSTRSQNLSAVSFYTTDTNANYEVKVYWNPNNGAVLNSSGPAFTQTGTFGNAGYHTIPIPSEIPLGSKDRFSVAIKLTNPTYNWSIALQDWTLRTTKARAYPGQGYTSWNGNVWTDITGTEGFKNSSICIKAFTKTTKNMNPGVFRDGVFYLRNSNTGGVANTNFNYGQTGDIPLVGDWDEDEIDTAGIFRNGLFALASDNTDGGGNVNYFTFGQAGDVPVDGDWNGDGITEVGIFRNGLFALASSNTDGGGNVNHFIFGQTGDVPVTGDWNGDGITEVGIFRNGLFALASSNTNGGGNVNYFTFGQTGDVPVTGDWMGQGRETIGVFRLGVFYLRNTNSAGIADLTFNYGSATDTPVDGKWI